MKTDLVEIFQTIRASLQPYAAKGYTVHENSETGYDLYSEKNIINNGDKVTERFFAGVYINGNQVELKLNTSEFTATNQNLIEIGDDKSGFYFTELNNSSLKEVETFTEIIHTHFKEKDWI